MRGVLIHARNPIKPHNGRFYRPTRDVAQVLSQVLWTPSGPDFRYTNFSDGRGFRILATQTFRVAVTVAVAFYLHKLFGWPGFRILPTHTFGAIPTQT